MPGRLFPRLGVKSSILREGQLSTKKLQKPRLRARGMARTLTTELSEMVRVEADRPTSLTDIEVKYTILNPSLLLSHQVEQFNKTIKALKQALDELQLQPDSWHVKGFISDSSESIFGVGNLGISVGRLIPGHKVIHLEMWITNMDATKQLICRLQDPLPTWPTTYGGMDVIVNRVTPSHCDGGGAISFYDHLLSLGQSHDAKLHLDDLKVEFDYPPGTGVWLTGRGIPRPSLPTQAGWWSSLNFSSHWIIPLTQGGGQDYTFDSEQKWLIEIAFIHSLVPATMSRSRKVKATFFRTRGMICGSGSTKSSGSMVVYTLTRTWRGKTIYREVDATPYYELSDDEEETPRRRKIPKTPANYFRKRLPWVTMGQLPFPGKQKLKTQNDFLRDWIPF
ncbi:hypothetical protein V8E55_005311 [Tylopilus felleus]